MASKCTGVLELGHKSNVLHHGSVVGMGCAAKTATSFTAVTIVLWTTPWYLMAISMMRQGTMYRAINGNGHRLLIGGSSMVVDGRTKTKGRCCWWEMPLEVLVLGRSELRLNLELELLADVVDRGLGVGATACL